MRPVSPTRILLLGLSPKDRARVRIDEEVRRIQQRLSVFGERFQVNYSPAVRASDLSMLLMTHKPEIVHISGHSERTGEAAAELLFEDAQGKAQPVPVVALAQQFLKLRGNIRCVVISACFSDVQAEAMAEHIDCTIGANAVVSDNAAIMFGERFYSALAAGQSVADAYEIAKNDLAIERIHDADAFRLFERPGVDASQSTFEPMPMTGGQVHSATRDQAELSPAVPAQTADPKMRAIDVCGMESQIHVEVFNELVGVTWSFDLSPSTKLLEIVREVRRRISETEWPFDLTQRPTSAFRFFLWRSRNDEVPLKLEQTLREIRQEPHENRPLTLNIGWRSPTFRGQSKATGDVRR